MIHSARQTVRKNRSLSLETLESREVMAASVIDPAGNLLIQGTAAADVVKISDLSLGGVQGFRIDMNGASEWRSAASVKTGVVVFSGGAGNDYFRNDALALAAQAFGGAGDDILIGGAKNDQLIGGIGNDQLFGQGGNDQVWGEAGNDTLAGGVGDDDLMGGDGNDSLYGETGNDRLFGEAGADLLAGGDGNDALFGGDGDDRLFGEAGDDLLFGEAGNDLLVGGLGRDYFNGGVGLTTNSDFTSGLDTAVQTGLTTAIYRWRAPVYW